MPEFYTQAEVEKHHKEIVWPTVRIKSKDAWGSGTIVYSKKDERGVCRTFVLTCHHVIADAIKVEKTWDQGVGMEVKKETRVPVEVQFFYYENLSFAKGLAFSCRANIKCYDAQQDIALLELELTEKVCEHVAFLISPEDVKQIHVFDPVYACGAALAHEPITTKGLINFMNDIIDDYDYWLSSAQIIFGNSGGAIFRYSDLRKRFEFIGMPARIELTAIGFSASPITHMGYFVPITRIYKVLKDNFYHFIYDSNVLLEDCEVARAKAAEENKKLYLARFGGEPLSSEGRKK